MDTLRKSIDDPPKINGCYNIEVEGLRTFLPIFADFKDGKWLFNGIANSMILSGYKAYYYENSPAADDMSLANE